MEFQQYPGFVLCRADSDIILYDSPVEPIPGAGKSRRLDFIHINILQYEHEIKDWIPAGIPLRADTFHQLFERIILVVKSLQDIGSDFFQKFPECFWGSG